MVERQPHKFHEIDFRYSDARNEKLHAPDLLTHGFVDMGNRLAEALSPDKYIVYGPKGSGKTALLGRIELEAQSQWNQFVATEELDEFDFSVLAFDSTVGGNANLFGWKFLLAARLLALMIEDEGLVQANPHLQQYADDLKSLGIIASTSLSTFAERTLRRGAALKFSYFADVSASTDTSSKWQPKTPAQIADSIIDFLSQMKSADGMYILAIDGLDFILKDGRNSISLIGDLLGAARSVNEQLVRAGINGKVMVLLRDEMARLIPSPDLTKRLNDNGIFLEWYQNTRDPLENEVFRIIGKRAQLVGLDPNIKSLWPKWFPFQIRDDSAARYIIERTRFLPRDVITFFRMIQSFREDPPFSRHVLIGAERKYSDWFFDELLDALAGLIPEQVRLEIRSILRDVERTFSVDDLHNALKMRGLDAQISGELLATTMFETHWLGNTWTSDRGEHFFSYKYRGRNFGFSPKRKCILHIGLRKALNVAY